PVLSAAPPPRSTPLPYTTLFRALLGDDRGQLLDLGGQQVPPLELADLPAVVAQEPRPLAAQIPVVHPGPPLEDRGQLLLLLHLHAHRDPGLSGHRRRDQIGGAAQRRED